MGIALSALYQPARQTKGRETTLWTNTRAMEARLSLRGAVSDGAISGFGQGLLRCARNDTLTLCHAVGVLSHSPKPLSAG
jgi:hypothetical protein